MSYLDQFVDAVRFLGEFEPQIAAEFDHVAMRNALHDLQTTDMSSIYAHLVEFLMVPLAELQVSKHPVDVGRGCHTVSHTFLETFMTNPVSGGCELSITVGNVFFRGENMYKVTREGIRQQIHDGPRDGDLPVHVWLTLEDMTVIDLTILTTLRQKGVDIPKPEGNVLVWRNSEPSDFRFEPLLVDNLFATRIDILSQ